jgi:trehalose 6-phosphate synthase
MNLVAKEYCASSIDGNGVLILSEFAGAADQMCRGALCVNPFDLENTADAIHTAFTMDREERARRMRQLRGGVKRNDVHQWLRWVMAFSHDADQGPSNRSEPEAPQHPVAEQTPLSQ